MLEQFLAKYFYKKGQFAARDSLLENFESLLLMEEIVPFHGVTFSCEKWDIWMLMIPFAKFSHINGIKHQSVDMCICCIYIYIHDFLQQIFTSTINWAHQFRMIVSLCTLPTSKPSAARLALPTQLGRWGFSAKDLPPGAKI